MSDRPVVRSDRRGITRGDPVRVDHTPGPGEPAICYPIEATLLRVDAEPAPETDRPDDKDHDVDELEDDSPLADEESPNKYETGNARSTRPISTTDVDESRVPRRWLDADVDVPDGVTPERLERAVKRDDTLLEVCAELGCPPAEKGAIRTLVTIDGLYDLLDRPEAGPTRRRA